MSRIAPGTRVTCNYRGDQTGTVLADNDPRAWAGTYRFPDKAPDPAAVRAYVALCESAGWGNRYEQPVLWDYGMMWWDTSLDPVAPTPARRLDSRDGMMWWDDPVAVPEEVSDASTSPDAVPDELVDASTVPEPEAVPEPVGEAYETYETTVDGLRTDRNKP